MTIDHVVDVGQLRDALGLIPPEMKVVPNAIGNLAILDADGDFVGWVDLGEDATVYWSSGELE